MAEPPVKPAARLRLVLSREVAFGPGKADILQGVRETGSIAAAGRRLHMSYKRAWSLVETMNGNFRAPLVESTRGGATGGGAALTSAGEQVLAHYRSLERQALSAGADDIAALEAMLSDMSGEK